MVKHVVQCVDIAELCACIAVLCVMCMKGLHRQFPFLASVIATKALNEIICIPLMFYRKSLGIDIDVAYRTYFATTWVTFFLQSALYVAVLYQVYSLAMKPLGGLRRAGTIIFRWVALVSILFSLSLAIGPHIASRSYLDLLAERIQQGLGILTLCLLLFVCFASRPLGMTYRSRTFGTALGLGILSTMSFVEAAWYTSSGSHSIYSPIYLVGSCGWLLASTVWCMYFVMPEPEARMVLLPTTSPFFLWNRVSEALGDEPGYVAVTGFRPEMLDPAELKVLTAASVMSRERRAREEAEEASESFAQGQLQPSGTLHSIALPR
jgi:hypothetical protein